MPLILATLPIGGPVRPILIPVSARSHTCIISASTDVVDTPPEVVQNSPYMPRLLSPYRIPKQERDDDLDERSYIRAPHDSSADPPKAFAPAMFGPAPSPAPSSPGSPTALAPPKRPPRKTTTLIRTSQLSNGRDPLPHQNRINLVIKGDLNSMTMGWYVVRVLF